jgi:serine protease Do
MYRMNQSKRLTRVVMPAVVAALLAAAPAIGPAPAVAEERSVIGVQIQRLTEDLAKGLGVPASSGVLVSGVRADSPAAKVGVKAGDIIVEYNGEKITEPRELSERVAATPVGKSVSMKVLRDGKEMMLSPTTAAMEAKEESRHGKRAEAPKAGKYGLVLHPLTAELAERLKTTEKQGLVVEAVREGSPAAEAGLERGDLITEVNRKPVSNAEELRAALEQSSPDKPAVLLVHRDGATRFVTLKG